MSARGVKIRTFDKKLKEQRDYWLAKLADKIEPANLRLDFERPRTIHAQTDRVEFQAPDDLQARLIRLAANSPMLIYAALLAALKICLHKYTRKETIIVGSPALLKKGADLPANALVLVDEITGNLSYRDLLENVRETMAQAYARQDYSYQALIRDLGMTTEPGNRCPLFDMALMFRCIHGELPQVNNDVSIIFSHSVHGLGGEIEYRNRLFKRESIERFRDHFLNILGRSLSNVDLPIRELEMLAEDERRRLLVEWNSTACEFPGEKCIHHLFEAQVERTPDAQAAAFEAEILSYSGLSRRANQVAHYLREQGVGPEVKVGILMDRSLEMLVGLLGIMKAGGAFVPLDPAYPKHRLGLILEDAEIPILLTQSRWADSLPEYHGKSLRSDTDASAIDRQSVDNPITAIEPENLAYVIYTSGSTGKPKGVAVSHRALVNFSLAVSGQFACAAVDRVLQFASMGFDVALEEIFPAWLCGAAVIIRDQKQLAAPSELTRVIEQEQITMIELPAAFWQEWTAELHRRSKPAPSSLRLVIVGSEKVAAEAVMKWREFNAQLKNVYGITETAITSTVYTDRAGADQTSLPIGKPIANTQTYVLDGEMNPAGIGIAGEIYIGGEGLARSYVGDAAPTAEKFIPNPFGTRCGARFYKTGDLAISLPSGDIEFIGRKDDQIKLRGFRVELGEIESALKQHAGIENAVVIVKEGTSPNLDLEIDCDAMPAQISGDRRLIAYVVPGHGQSPVIEDLRSYLRRQLPAYMVPTTFVVLDKLPLTHHGKVDRAALPAPPGTSPGLQERFVTPRDAIEQKLADIYAQVLRLDQVGVLDDFFELGGHSLLATQVISRVRTVFEVELPLLTLFESPIVEELAQYLKCELEQRREPAAPKLRRADRSRNLPLSFAQQRLWFINQLEPESALYNVPAALRLKGELDVAAFERSLQEIVRRHEVLRTTFPSERGEPVQVISDDWQITLSVIDLSLLAADVRLAATERLANEEAGRGFNLSRGPLLRCELLQLAERDHVVVINMHHIINDGWSIGQLISELTALYDSYSKGAPSPLADLEIQYADFAVWQREYMTRDVLEQQRTYWKEQLTGMQILDLPTDNPRPAGANHRGGNVGFALSAETTSQLSELSRQEGATLFMLLLAAFKVVLHNHLGLDDIAVGTVVANRNRSEIENLIGYFVNNLVLRTKLEGAPTFRALLRRVKEVALGAYANQDLPYEKVVELVRPERNLNHSPLFNVAVVMDNTSATKLALPGLEIEVLSAADQWSKFDLLLALNTQPSGLLCTFSYDLELFDASIIKLSRHFEALLNYVLIAPDATVKDLRKKLGEVDKEQLRLSEKEVEEAGSLIFKTGRRKTIIQPV